MSRFSGLSARAGAANCHFLAVHHIDAGGQSAERGGLSAHQLAGKRPHIGASAALAEDAVDVGGNLVEQGFDFVQALVDGLQTVVSKVCFQFLLVGWGKCGYRHFIQFVALVIDLLFDGLYLVHRRCLLQKLPLLIYPDQQVFIDLFVVVA